MASKARSTQLLVNAYPAEANIRKDEQSLGYQLFNSVGKIIDDLRIQLDKAEANQYISTSIVSDIDIYYKVKLANSYEFTKQDDDNTSFIFTPPTVSGYIGDVNYSVTIADDNDIESFWYKPVPDRLSLSETVYTDHFIASGLANHSPLSQQVAQSGLLHIPNQLTVTVASGSSFLGIESNGVIRRGIVQIEGKNRQGADLTEDLIFLQNETRQTLNEFSEVSASGLRVYGINDRDTAFVRFDSAAFNQVDYPIQYELDVTVNKDDMPLFWALGSGEQAGVNTLDVKKYDIDDIEMRIEGFSDKHTIFQQELLDVSETNISPTDMSPEPHSNRLWVCDSDKLYVFKNDFPYPNLQGLQGKQYDSSSVIEPSSYYVVLGDNIQLDYVWLRPVQNVLSHRAWVEKPDGTKKSLESGSEVTYHTDSTSWIFGEPTTRQLRGTEIYTLDQRGNWVYSLEVRYSDGTTSLDRRIILVASKVAETEFSLSTLGISNPIQGIDFDSEYNLWVLDNTGTKYKIDRHHDRMLIDFDKKIIYFREPYSKVRVL